MWPCPEGKTGGTPVLYSNGFPSGKAWLVVPDFRVVEKRADLDYPLLLVPGRVLLQSDRELDVVKGRLNRVKRDETLEMHPKDVEKFGIEEGELVIIATRERQFQGKVKIGVNPKQGVISSTALFAQLAVDLESSERPDPMFRVPGLNIAILLPRIPRQYA